MRKYQTHASVRESWGLDLSVPCDACGDPITTEPLCSRTFGTCRVDHRQSHGNPTNRDYDMSANPSFLGSGLRSLHAVHSCLTVIGIVYYNLETETMRQG